uniref:CWF19-like protein 2 n=1 Tax=Romanomermis culicivorax TaxID=13658 RepID=A0A915KG81_ROMCU
MDEDIYDEMKKSGTFEDILFALCFISSPNLYKFSNRNAQIWRRGLVAMFNEADLDVIFMEMAKNVNHQPHTVVECYPVPKSIGDLAPMYFKKALLECEEEWAQNKKIVDLSKKDLRKSIPRGFSYFAVDFGLQNGYCHVIENETKFAKTFGQEIICGMMDLDESLWRRPVKQTLDEQTKRAEHLRRKWMPFDWTERVKERLKND